MFNEISYDHCSPNKSYSLKTWFLNKYPDYIIIKSGNNNNKWYSYKWIVQGKYIFYRLILGRYNTVQLYIGCIILKITKTR